ncbi:MAG TPA: hypothetical protein VFL59_17095, partial [Candidatus Nanopelagicales bacterium]|nr:hypothetical protein [Candidatus Nanopelagicales bacterium]
MDKGMLAVLTDTERLLVAQTDKASLAAMDEDALADLHDKIRRARNKASGQYRRGASSRVKDVGGRGKAHAQNQRARDRAEVYEVALAAVSTALAAAARRSAAELKADRIASARAGKPVKAAATSTTAKRAAAPAAATPSTPSRSTGSKRPAPSRAKKNAQTT